MSSPKQNVMLSIGELRTSEGHPMVCIVGGGVLGTVDEMKELIARYEESQRKPRDAV